SRAPALGLLVRSARGGTDAELFGERAMRRAPVAPADADSMLRECRGLDALLRGYRGRPPADRAALTELLVRTSQLASRLGKRLVSLDLNPVMAGAQGGPVVAARAVVQGE